MAPTIEASPSLDGPRTTTAAISPMSSSQTMSSDVLVYGMTRVCHRCGYLDVLLGTPASRDHPNLSG